MWPGVMLEDMFTVQEYDFYLDDVTWPWGYDGDEVVIEGNNYFRAGGVKKNRLWRWVQRIWVEKGTRRDWRLKG